MFPAAAREGLILLAISFFVGLAFNGVTGQGIFGTGEAGPASPSGAPLPSSEIISLEQAKALYDTGEALFIDTRHAYDFELGHIAGAVNMPLKGADAAVSALTEPTGRTLVLYCDGAECNSSLEVGGKLVMKGYTDVRIFFGGWRSWNEMGYPIEGESR